tara:strand:- start:347 stop:724 length:378 start_codon:yes stop_codon:yes gene_type:complete
MLDYYGSIVKSEKEIDNELIQRFKNRCHESYMKIIINNLRKEEVLQKEYSVSGWMVFHAKTIHEIIDKSINYQSQKNEKLLKFIYSYYNSEYYNRDISELISENYKKLGLSNTALVPIPSPGNLP